MDLGTYACEEEVKNLSPGPLLHVVSISIQPSKIISGVYGWISVQHFDSTYGYHHLHYLYDRPKTQVEFLDTDGTLTLNGPDVDCDPDSAFIPMFINKINAQLFDEDGNPLFDEEHLTDPISLDETEIEGGYEQVKSVRVPCVQESLYLVVRYIAIPFGYSARFRINFKSVHHNRKHNSINVNGKIVARWVNTYGSCSSEECVLFKKDPPNAVETVEIDGEDMLLSRCWVALPAYSSLVIDVDLSDDSGRYIVGSVKLLLGNGFGSGGKIYLDDMYIEVGVTWFNPTPLGRYDGKVPMNGIRTLALPKEEEMDIEEEDEPSSNPANTWEVRPQKYKKHKPFSSPAIEIFSIFVGRKESKAVELHGSIEVCSLRERVCYVFNRDEKNPLFLSQHMMTAPIVDDDSSSSPSRLHGDYHDLEIKFNMKDIGGNVAVKGYGKWDGEILEYHRYRNKQLCCFIQGEQGFVALHYSIFSRAVFACPKIFLNLKKPSNDVYPKVYGSLTCEYRYHFYSSKYNRDYYSIVLFTKTQGDAFQLDGKGLLPLCRSLVVVPSYSPLIINLELELECGLKVSSRMEFEIGDKSKEEDKGDFTIRIEVDWSEIK